MSPFNYRQHNQMPPNDHLPHRPPERYTAKPVPHPSISFAVNERVCEGPSQTKNMHPILEFEHGDFFRCSPTFLDCTVLKQTVCEGLCLPHTQLGDAGCCLQNAVSSWQYGKTRGLWRVGTTGNKGFPDNAILYNKDNPVCIYHSYLSLFEHVLLKLFASQRFPRLS